MSVMGELITETLEYDGGRDVTVYVPPEPPEAVVFAGDGQLISQWGSVVEAAGVPSTMVVGAHRLADETMRLGEYSPGFDPERFAAHERFLVEDVRQWVRTRFGVALPVGRTAVFGVSASGELALAIGLRHPDVYGAIFCASPGGGYRPPGVMPSSIPRTYLVAGRREPFFLKNAARWADALRDAGADVVMKERKGSHGDAFWKEEIAHLEAGVVIDLRITRDGRAQARQDFAEDPTVLRDPSGRRSPGGGVARSGSGCGWAMLPIGMPSVALIWT
jgi:pimeloyl-ACP methyl ester carboxylesterase